MSILFSLSSYAEIYVSPAAGKAYYHSGEGISGINSNDYIGGLTVFSYINDNYFWQTSLIYDAVMFRYVYKSTADRVTMNQAYETVDVAFLLGADLDFLPTNDWFETSSLVGVSFDLHFNIWESHEYLEYYKVYFEDKDIYFLLNWGLGIKKEFDFGTLFVNYSINFELMPIKFENSDVYVRSTNFTVGFAIPVF